MRADLENAEDKIRALTARLAEVERERDEARAETKQWQENGYGEELARLTAALAKSEADAAAMVRAMTGCVALLDAEDWSDCAPQALPLALALLSTPNPGRALLEAVEVAGADLERMERLATDVIECLESRGNKWTMPLMDRLVDAQDSKGKAALAPWRKGEG